MEFTEIVELRRSVRAFKEGETISREDLEAIIKCAQEAPTWKHSQTGRYYVIETPEMVEKIRTETLPSFNQNSSANSSALIVTTFEKTRSGFERDGSPTTELGDEWGAYDLGLSNAYLILKARELGYDTLIMGIRDSDKLRTELNIPDSQAVVAVIAVGKRTADPAKPARKELDSVAKFF